MATQLRARRRAPAVAGGYRRLLVPMLPGAESERAVEVACRLAAERHATLTVVTPIEIPPLLPLDARMDEEEAEAHRLHARALAIADAYGVAVVPRMIRARELAEAILEPMESAEFELVVIGAPRRENVGRRMPAFGRAVQHVLRRASCRVLVIAPATGS